MPSSDGNYDDDDEGEVVEHKKFKVSAIVKLW